MHFSCPFFDEVPAAHLEQDVYPFSDFEPAGQCSQSFDPASEMVPFGHEAHDVEAALDEKVPALQSMQLF